MKQTIYIIFLGFFALPVMGQIPVVKLPEVATVEPVVLDDSILGLTGPKSTPNTGAFGLAPDAASMNRFNSLSQTEKHRVIMWHTRNNIAARTARQQQVREILREVDHELGSPVISYELRGKNIPGRELFYQAYRELRTMLSGKNVSLKKAVFLYEKAFNPSLDWNRYNDRIGDMVQHIGIALQQKGIKRDDHISQNMMLFRFFTDTLTVWYPGTEKPVSSFPLLYDFDDFWGEKDYNNVFVTKLLQTGSGQCHSLPLLYLILAEEIGTKAHLAFSPSHSYIKIQDELGNWYNLELTNHAITSDQFITYSGYIKSEALMNKVYMHPLTAKEVIAQTVMDLASAYVKKYGYEKFVRHCTNLANSSGLKSMSIHKHSFNYYLTLHNYILDQYRKHGLTREDFRNDEKAMQVYQQVEGAHKHIKKQGYMDMPRKEYEKWLNSVQKEARKQEHKTRMRALMGQIK